MQRIGFIWRAQTRPLPGTVWAVVAVISLWDLAGAQLVPESVGQKWPRIYDLAATVIGLLPGWGWVIIALALGLFWSIEFGVRQGRRHSQPLSRDNEERSKATTPNDGARVDQVAASPAQQLDSRPTLEITYEEPEVGQNRPPYGWLETFEASALVTEYFPKYEYGLFVFQGYRIGILNTTANTARGVFLELTSMSGVNNAYRPTPMRVRLTESQSTVELAPGAQEFFDMVTVNVSPSGNRREYDESILWYANRQFANRFPRRTCELLFTARGKMFRLR